LSQLVPFGDYLFIFVVLLYVLTSLFGTMLRSNVITNRFFYVINATFVLLTLLSPVLGIPILVAFVGYLNITLMFTFWFFYFRNKGITDFVQFEKVQKKLVIVGLILAVAAILQFFVNSTLWGLLPETIFTDNDRGANYTKRAVSFISSPQALSITLGVLFALSIKSSFKIKILKPMILSLIFIAGVLTFSKAFFVFLAIYWILSLRKSFFFSMILGCFFLLTISLTEYLGDENGLQRILNIPKLLSNIENYHSFEIWYYYFSQNIEDISIIVGKGIGSLSRAYEIFVSPLFISSESYIIQIYYETGVLGVFVIGYTYLYAIYNLYKSDKTKYLSFILIAFMTNMIASPAFYGFSTSFLVSPIWVFGIFKKNN